MSEGDRAAAEGSGSGPDSQDVGSSRVRGDRRVILAGLLLSAAIHALLFGVFGGVQFPATPYTVSPVEMISAPSGLNLVELTETFPEFEERPAPEPPDPAPPEAPFEEAPFEEVAPDAEKEDDEAEPIPGLDLPAMDIGNIFRPPGADPEEGRERRSNVSRLRLRFSDARLWIDPGDPWLVGQRMARFATADSAVRAIIGNWLDSLQLTAEQERRARDWTTGEEGKRWGISPEGLHLGGVTIPIPFAVMGTGPQRRALEQAVRDLAFIQRQDLRYDLDAVLRERREAMRLRAEEEARRREARQDTTGSGRRSGARRR